MANQTYTELTIIIGQASGEEKNMGIMLAIAQSVLTQFSDSVNAVLSDTNQGRLIVTRKQRSSKSSSSAPMEGNT